MIKVKNVFFYADGTWHYIVHSASQQLYCWKWENDNLWWSPTRDATKAHWIKWTTYFSHDEEIKEAIKTLIIESTILKDC